MDRFEQLRLLWTGITGRLILGVVVVQAILTPLLFYGILLIVERSFESRFVDQIRNNTLLYAQIFKSISGDAERRASFLYEIQLSGDVVFAEFVDTQGNVARSEVIGPFKRLEFQEDFEFGEHADDVYFIGAQLFSDTSGQSLGILRLGYDELSVQEQISAAYRFGALVAAGYVIFSTLLAIFFGRRLLSPVSAIRSFATRIAEGEDSADLDLNTDIFELKQLGEDLQRMHRSLIATQQEILHRELNLKAVVDHAGEGIITIDAEGNIQSFNIAAEEIFGYTTQEVVGTPISTLMPSPYNELHEDYLRDHVATGEGKFIGERRRLQAKRKDGEVIPIYLTVSEVQLDEEISFTGIIHDLSEEEKREAELQQLSRAVEQSPVSILITNVAGHIEYVNPSFCEMTGYTMEEVFGKNPKFLNSGQTSQEEYRRFWETISGGGIWQGIFRNKTKSGDLFWLSSTVCPVHDQGGTITHYISISENITAARKRESMLNQAMKLEAIGRMTDGISHDFNNLLTIIQGNLKFLGEDLESDNEEHMELIEDALSAAQDGTDLVKRLLAFSRRQEVDVQVLNINDSLLAMERLLQRSVPDVNIEFDLDNSIGNALVDSNRLESAVLNMVTNSRDAMPGGGMILISTTEEVINEGASDDTMSRGSYVVLTVSDNGVGMDEETRKKAIEPFYTTKPIEAGTGLGLTMVQDFVQQCGGELHIDSAPNEGTTIKLFLPSSGEAEKTEADIESEESLPTGAETILVVEDREGVRRFACRILRRLGYQTYEAEDSTAAMAALNQYKDIDLLFSDIVMPGDTDGRQLANEAIAEVPGLKVLLTTGMEPTTGDETRVRENFRVLAKPYTAEELALTIRMTLDSSSPVDK